MPEPTGNRLAGKVAVITGAAGGIGSQAARRFAAEGARLLLVDHDEAAVHALAAELGAQAAALAGDVAAEPTAKSYVAAALRHFGQLDIALLNAGIEGPVAPIPDIPLAEFDRVIAVNLRGVWLGLAATMPAMQAGGSIVITASTSGVRGTASLAPYVASKHAVVGLMRSAAQEGGPAGIRVNCVNPGPTSTRMIDALDDAYAKAANQGGRSHLRAQREARIPLRRYGEAEDVANLMLFLASDESRYCSGGTYMVDGGLLSATQ